MESRYIYTVKFFQTVFNVSLKFFTLKNKILKFFQAVAVAVLLYSCTTSTQMKCLEKKLDGNYIRKLCAVNKSGKQHPPKQQKPPILQTIQERQAKHTKHNW